MLKIIVERYIRQGRFASAEKFCQIQPGKKRGYCYLCMVDAYLDIGKYKIALEWCNKLLVKRKEENSLIYLRMGRAYVGLGDYEKALKYFEETESSEYRARAYKKLADNYYKNGNHTFAKAFYNKALEEYTFLVKHFFCGWAEEYNENIRWCHMRLDTLEKTESEKAEQALLETILNGAAQYCEKLRKAVFYCFCHEKVKETLNLYYPKLPESGPSMTNTYLYEYQLIQDHNCWVQESRKLLKQNGIRRRRANAKLEIKGCKYEKLVFGPVELISKNRQELFYYKILNEEELWGEPAVVIEALPRYYLERMFGKIWVSKDDFSIMKIEWCPKSIKGSHLMEERARYFRAAPGVTFFTEYKYKRKGIRFPTTYFLEEAYILKSQRKFDRLILDITFDNYMFFEAGSEVTETTMEEKR